METLRTRSLTYHQRCARAGEFTQKSKEMQYRHAVAGCSRSPCICVGVARAASSRKAYIISAVIYNYSRTHTARRWIFSALSNDHPPNPKIHSQYLDLHRLFKLRPMQRPCTKSPFSTQNRLNIRTLPKLFLISAGKNPFRKQIIGFGLRHRRRGRKRTRKRRRHIQRGHRGHRVQGRDGNDRLRNVCKNHPPIHIQVLRTSGS